MEKIKIVVATRCKTSEFFHRTALGKSLSIYKEMPHVQIRLFSENSYGLPKVYNTAISESRQEPCTLIFAHDDLAILDYFWDERVHAGLEHFDLIGLAGNKRRKPGQINWAFVDSNFTWDDPENLSGTVGHGKAYPPETLSRYGISRQPVKILDGLFLAIRSNTLLSHDLWFDEQFKFHFYDLDFSRQADNKGLSCGTWDISVLHESGGNFGTREWNEALISYRLKWGD